MILIKISEYFYEMYWNNALWSKLYVGMMAMWLPDIPDGQYVKSDQSGYIADAEREGIYSERWSFS